MNRKNNLLIALTLILCIGCHIYAPNKIDDGCISDAEKYKVIYIESMLDRNHYIFYLNKLNKHKDTIFLFSKKSNNDIDCKNRIKINDIYKIHLDTMKFISYNYDTINRKIDYLRSGVYIADATGTRILHIKKGVYLYSSPNVNNKCYRCQ